MLKGKRARLCPNCNGEVGGNVKVCPYCGSKIKKPFYRRWWFIVLAIIMVFSVYSSISDYINSKIDWDEVVLAENIPKPPSSRGEIFSNDRESMSIDLIKVSKKEYTEYIKECEANGYNIDKDTKMGDFIAFNNEGYKLILSHYESEDKMDLKLEAPMTMGPINWPNNGLAKLLPVPKSKIGKIENNSEGYFEVYLDKTSLKDTNDYIDKCIKKGFNKDYNREEKSYSAEDNKENKLSVEYVGNNVMRISLSEPDDEDDTDLDMDMDSEDEESESGIRPKFKEAMDSYEGFMNEYCDFMKTYSKSDSKNSEMLSKYATFMDKYSKAVDDFEALEDEDLNSAEMSYYTEVQTRVSKKLLEVGLEE